MYVMGIRCSKKDYAYAVLTGTLEEPSLIDNASIALPKGYTQPEKLNWFLHELEELNNTHGLERWVVKGAEPSAAKGSAHVARVELESIVMLSAARSGYTDVERKVKSTIAKHLGLKGKASALKDDLNKTKINRLREMKENDSEAVIAAWSGLPK